MIITEIIVTVCITGGFGYIAKKLESLEVKIDHVENDMIRLATNIEKRAEVRNKQDR